MTIGSSPWARAKRSALVRSGNRKRTWVSVSPSPLHPIKKSMAGRFVGSNCKIQLRVPRLPA